MRSPATIALCFMLPVLAAGCMIPFEKTPVDAFLDITQGPHAILHVGSTTQAEIYRAIGPPWSHSRAGDIWQYTRSAYGGFVVFFPPLVLVHAQGLVGPFAITWDNFYLDLAFDEAGVLQRMQTSRSFNGPMTNLDDLERTSQHPLEIHGSRATPTTRADN